MDSPSGHRQHMASETNLYEPTGALCLPPSPLALNAWSRAPFDREVLLFIDNDAAASALVRGYSPRQDSCAPVGDFWLAAATSSKLSVYIDRVESKSNPADGPSPLDFSLMRHLQAQWGAVMPFTSQSHHRCEHNFSTGKRKKPTTFTLGKRASLPVPVKKR